MGDSRSGRSLGYAAFIRCPNSIVVAVCSAALAVVPGRAVAQAPVSLPASPTGLVVPTGEETVHLDLATLPQTTYHLDTLGQPVPSLRLGQWAGLSTRTLADDRLRVVLNFRYDLNTSATPAEVAAFPWLALHRFSLLTGYVEYDATKSLRLRAGRQLYADAADFLAFDGLHVGWRLPVPLKLEAYGGLRSSVGTPTGSIASSVFELDGVAQVNGWQPVAGATLRWVGDLLRRQEASLGYRHAWRTSESDVGLDPTLPKGPYTTVQELVGSAASDAGPLHLAGAFAYSIVLERLIRARATAAWEVSDEVTAALEYQRFQPAFALDSIWNFFSASPFDELGVNGVWRVDSQTRLEGRGFARFFQPATTDRFGSPYPTSPGLQPAAGVRAGGVRVLPAEHGFLSLDAFASYQDGFGGRRALLDSGVRFPLFPLLELTGRLTLAWFQQDSAATRQSAALGLVAGVSWRLPWGGGVSLLVEENLNAFASPVPRLLGVLDLARWL